MVQPNFLVIGATKSGTTSLYNYLKQHPQIYLTPVKETNFFAFMDQRVNFRGPGDQNKINRTSVTDWEGYNAQFSAVNRESAIGEISPLYMYFPMTAQRIYDAAPAVKLIAILRNPVDRAYSNYLHLRRDGREPCAEFSDAIAQEKKRIEENWGPFWHYQALGFYGEQLGRYYQLFNKEQIRIYLYDEFVRDPRSVLKDIFHFFEVDESVRPNLEMQYNVSGIPKNPKLHQLLTKTNYFKQITKRLLPDRTRRNAQILLTRIRNRNLMKPNLDQTIRQKLRDLYQEDILLTQKLIGKNLSYWLHD